MEKFTDLSDRDIEALIAGYTPAGAEGVDGVAGFVRTAKANVPEALDPAIERMHLAAIVDAARLMESGDPGLEGSIREKTMLSTLFASLWIKVAAGAMGVVLAAGGLAAAHVLPDPAQDAVASVADQIGIDLPSSDDEGDDASDIDDDEGDDDDDADDDDEGDDDDDADDADEGDDASDIDDDEADDDDESDDQDEADDDAESDDQDEADDDAESDDQDEADDDAEADEVSEDDSADASDESSDDDSEDGSDDESDDDAPEDDEVE